MTNQALPFYESTGNEIDLFEHAHRNHLPVLIKGPTGVGKTRFVAYMAAKLGLPLYTVACHDDLTAADLVGRHLIGDGATYWSDGPLTRAVREGAICYLDEIVEARKDTTVLIHSLTDHRRMLPVEKLGETLDAHPDFLLVISYNPGYQSVLKDLKPSTRQRFVSLDFDYPDVERETRIVRHESGVDEASAERLSVIGERVRNLREHGFEEGVSTRLLIYAAKLITRGIEPRRACDLAIARSVTDDEEVVQAINEIVDILLP